MNNREVLESAEIMDEKLAFAIVVRGDANNIKDLKDYIHRNNLQIVFKKMSLDRLYVINSKEYTQLMKQE